MLQDQALTVSGLVAARPTSKGQCTAHEIKLRSSRSAFKYAQMLASEAFSPLEHTLRSTDIMVRPCHRESLPYYNSNKNNPHHRSPSKKIHPSTLSNAASVECLVICGFLAIGSECMVVSVVFSMLAL